MFLDRIPLRWRLTLLHALTMATIYAASGYGLYRFLADSLDDSLNAALLSAGQSIRSAHYLAGGLAIRGHRRPLHGRWDEPLLRETLAVEHLLGSRFVKPNARIINASGRVAAQSEATARVAALPVSATALRRAERGLTSIETFELRGQPALRQVTLPVLRRGRFTGDLVQVGAYLTSQHETLASAAWLLWLILPASVLLSVGVGYILTARALHSVRVMTQTASSIYIDDMSIRFPIPAAKDEIRALSCTFNLLFDRLEDAVKRLRRFTGDVSHELRTPLAVLRGEAELSLRRQRNSQEYQNSLKNIAKEAVHMTTIIEELLLLARAESKAVAMNWSDIHVETLVNDLLDQVGHEYRQRQVTLETSFSTVSKFSCSPNYLTLALKNILLNAAKHSHSGSSVHLEIYPGENELLIFEIRDQGEGIPGEALANIFDPFYRVASDRNRAEGGAGIGLSLALAMVKLHEGDISVESSLGVGTTLRAAIPRKTTADLLERSITA